MSPGDGGPGPGPTPALPGGVRRVRERRVGERRVDGADRGVPRVELPGWTEELPWLVHGTTTRGDGDPPFDLGLFGDQPVGAVLERWRALRRATGLDRAAHSLQVHGRELLDHEDDDPGLFVTEGYDGHVTTRPGILLTVSAADCVPISLVDGAHRRIALLHGGWRGTAAGVVAAGVHRMRRLGTDPSTLLAHLGPAICGECYEVGPEVHDALGLPVPDTNTPVDVRAVQARQLVEAGVAPERVTVSEHCTRCGDGFFSHRAGSPGRQLGILGIRAG